MSRSYLLLALLLGSFAAAAVAQGNVPSNMILHTTARILVVATCRTAAPPCSRGVTPRNSVHCLRSLEFLCLAAALRDLYVPLAGNTGSRIMSVGSEGEGSGMRGDGRSSDRGTESWDTMRGGRSVDQYGG